MKIGLEFEGVIRSSKTGHICRWPKIPEESRKLIKRMIYERREKVEPIDTYDCLAEVRTLPILDPSPYKLLHALFTEMELATQAFMAAGYHIQWSEQEIPDELHNEIQHNINHPAAGYKIKKDTYTITNKGCVLWESAGNRFRGGGLHINVSPVPRIFSTAFITNLHAHLEDCRRHTQFHSHYRNNILFRCRYDNNDKDWKEPIAEYMSFGFNLPKIQGWKDSADAILSNSWYCSGNSHDHVRWAWTLINFLKEWHKDVQSYQTLLK